MKREEGPLTRMTRDPASTITETIEKGIEEGVTEA